MIKKLDPIDLYIESYNHNPLNVEGEMIKIIINKLNEIINELEYLKDFYKKY